MFHVSVEEKRLAICDRRIVGVRVIDKTLSLSMRNPKTVDDSGE